MKLRTRLFLWVGIIFIFAFGLSLIFEIFTTDKNLKEAEVALREKILHLNEERRSHMEEYLHVALAEDQAQVDSLLLRIARDPKFGATLFLDPPNVNLAAPAHSAYLFKNARWIDFIQTTKDNELSSLLVPIDFPMKTAHEVPIDERISWVLLDSDKEMQHPYIGVRLRLDPPKGKDFSILIDQMIEMEWGMTILFNPEGLLGFEPKKIKDARIEGQMDISAFLLGVEHAAEYLKKNQEKGWIKKDIEKRTKGDIFKEKPFDRGIQCLEKEGEVVNDRIIQLLQRGDQAIMLSTLTSLYPGGEFGSTPFDRMAPKGIARFPEKNQAGHLVLSEEALFQKQIFDAAKYLQMYPSYKECKGLGSSIAVIASPDLERAFIGNALALKGKSAEGSLTVAIDADKLLQDLVLSVHKDAFLVHKGKIINGYNMKGDEIPNPSKSLPLDEKMLKTRSGLISWHGKCFYYLHMTPFKDLDLHFFILETEKEAFSLVHSLDKGSREVIKHVSFNMRIIAVIALALVLLLLQNVAKRITKPITSLARLTQDVASGKLEDIELPEAPKGRHDEIAVLCESFSQMVVGLREKEKVKGVLNKVVSPEIAEEIMKGKIHLGGEERKVTILFADIRSFTHMSANKSPQEVIEMLNNCMTKVSHEIDEFGGVIDKYVGDEVMALFGAPLEKEDSSLKAVQCALKIVDVLREWNKERTEKGLHPIEMGIGIHTGVVIAGNMGSENRLNYTVIGSNANLASRLCSIAKPMEILITKDTLVEPRVQEGIDVEQMPPTEIKGFDKSFIFYRVKGGK